MQLLQNNHLIFRRLPVANAVVAMVNINYIKSTKFIYYYYKLALSRKTVLIAPDFHSDFIYIFQYFIIIIASQQCYGYG